MSKDASYDEVDKLYDVLGKLAELNIHGSLEYPGYIEVRENDGRVRYFGFANGTFGWNDDKGDGGESTLDVNADPGALAAYVDSVCK